MTTDSRVPFSPPQVDQTPASGDNDKKKFSQTSGFKGDLTDGRGSGDWKSVYPYKVWAEIFIEVAYLFVVALASLATLIVLAAAISSDAKIGVGSSILAFFGPPPSVALSNLVIGLSGVIGGCTFSIKWLYHAIAKAQWHQDRRVWRYTVPVISGVIAVFFGALNQGGILTLFALERFTNLLFCAGFGFVLGYFSDAAMGAMSNAAHRILGTVRDR